MSPDQADRMFLDIRSAWSGDMRTIVQSINIDNAYYK